MGVHEGLLHRVFRSGWVGFIQQPSAVALELRPIAVDDRREGRLVALASEGHEPRVVLQTQE